MEYLTRYSSPIGELTLVSDGHALTGLRFESGAQAFRPQTEYEENPGLPVFDASARWLDRYFSGQIPGVTPPLSFPDSTPFRRLIQELLQEIPYGSTVSYGELAQRAARRMGTPRMSAQAVGSACARNPIPIFVPCHRVIGADGSLTGYAGGLAKKQFLLELESRAAVSLHE